MKNWFLALSLFAFSTAAARADLPPPQPKEPTAPLEIVANPKVAEARIQIPRKLLGKMTSLDEGDDSSASANSAPRTHTIVAGLCLAMALAFGGLWIVRHRGTRNLALLLGMALSLGVGATVWADGLAPRDIKPRPDRTNLVVIEVVDKGETVKLIVNKEKLAKALEEKK